MTIPTKTDSEHSATVTQNCHSAVRGAFSPEADPYRYRREREATEEEMFQLLKNILRRMLRRPIRKTGAEAHAEVMEGRR